jgi:hypothetical protein
MFVAPGLPKFPQNDPVLVNRAPEPEFPTQDHHDDFVEMPNISGTRLPAAQISGDLRTEFCLPTLAHFLDVAQGEVEADIKLIRVRDDLWCKTVALVADDHTHAQQLRKISNPSNRPELM